MFRIVRSVLIVETVEVVEDRPSRPRGGPAAARPVIDVPGEEMPESTTRLRVAAPSNVIPLPLPPHAGLDIWLDRQARAGR